MKVFAFLTGILFSIIMSSEIQSQTFTPRYNSGINPNVTGYYEYLPAGYNLPQNANKKYPVIFYFHGGGEFGSYGNNNNNLEILKQSALPHIINTGKLPSFFTLGDDTFSYIIICPQFINGPGSIPSTDVTPAQIDAVINYTFSQPNYRIDLGKVYLTGFSVGGKPPWEYIMGGLQYARKIAAIIPISNWCYLPSLDTLNLRFGAQAGVAIWALHQPQDLSALPSQCYTPYIRHFNSYNPFIAAQGTNVCVPGFPAPCAHDSSFWNTIYTCANYTLPGTGLNIYQWLYYFRLTNIWKGTADGQWENPSNWSLGVVPDSYMDIIINAATPFSPTLNSITSIYGINVKTGATITISPGARLTVTRIL